MALLRIRSSREGVVTDARGRPRAIVIDERARAVSAIEGVREEVHAYPSSTGPRTLFVVAAGGTRYRLVRNHRDRSWEIHRLAVSEGSLATAA